MFGVFDPDVVDDATFPTGLLTTNCALKWSISQFMFAEQVGCLSFVMITTATIFADGTKKRATSTHQLDNIDARAVAQMAL